MSIPPGQHDAQLFWLALPGAVRAATGGAESPPAAPEFNRHAMVDKVLSELAASGGLSVLISDDPHELSSGYGENAWAGVKAHRDTGHQARQRPSSRNTPGAGRRGHRGVHHHHHHVRHHAVAAP
jgi:hypothetical protein